MTDCSYPNDRRASCHHADDAAKKAVRETFAILGVNVDDPQQVREFQDSLRFSDRLRKTAEKGMITFVISIAGLAVAALWTGIKFKIGGGNG